VLSQRLVRVLCAACRRPVTCEGTELGEIGIELPAGSTIYLPGGCARCESTGYLGRTGMFEMLILDEQLRQEVNDGKPEDEFARSARAAGYRDYREDGAEKVLLGITSAEEVLKAI
jgi:general secretion pathway protein E